MASNKQTNTKRNEFVKHEMRRGKIALELIAAVQELCVQNDADCIPLETLPAGSTERADVMKRML